MIYGSRPPNLSMEALSFSLARCVRRAIGAGDTYIGNLSLHPSGLT